MDPIELIFVLSLPKVLLSNRLEFEKNPSVKKYEKMRMKIKYVEFDPFMSHNSGMRPNIENPLQFYFYIHIWRILGMVAHL